jgi:hypothetical protein
LPGNQSGKKEIVKKGGLNETVMQMLRERGIYSLSSAGEELVAHAVFRGGYVLYTPRDWEFFGPYSYECAQTGFVSSDGQCWHIDDLIDTNRTARSRSRSGAGQV